MNFSLNSMELIQRGLSPWLGVRISPESSEWPDLRDLCILSSCRPVGAELPQYLRSSIALGEVNSLVYSLPFLRANGHSRYL